MRYGMVEKYISDYPKAPSLRVLGKKTVCLIALYLVEAQGVCADDGVAEKMTTDLWLRTSLIARDTDEIETLSGEAAGLVQTAFALNMVTFGFGIGYHLDIIPDLLLPGVYFDFGLGPFQLLLDMDDDPETGIAIHWGGRVFNQFRVADVDIEPFAGITGTYIDYTLDDKIAGYWVKFGVILACEYIGIEYAFLTPLFPPTDKNKITHIGDLPYHRLAIGFHKR
jgi:hypothetical protein